MASFGASSARIFCIASFVFDAARLKNTFVTRVRSSPERSIASSVFAKVGGAGSFAIASISAICRFIPSSIAGT